METITLNSENIEEIPKFVFSSFWLPRILKNLSLQSCKIKEIPEDISTLSVLEQLNLSGNIQSNNEL